MQCEPMFAKRLLQEGDSFQGPRVCSCLTLGNELSKETKQGSLLGRGAWMENSRVREPRRTALPSGLRLVFVAMGLVSWLSLTNHSDPRGLPGDTHITQPRWLPVRRFPGRC